MIEPLPRGARDYVAKLGCIHINTAGRLRAGRPPRDAVAAWWCEDPEMAATIARTVPRSASVEEASAELQSFASRNGITLTDHTTVLARAGAAAVELDRRLEAAKASGLLSFFNSEYRRRREAAKAAGRGFMNYNAAYGRLRRAIASAADGTPTPDLLAVVFGDG